MLFVLHWTQRCFSFQKWNCSTTPLADRTLSGTRAIMCSGPAETTTFDTPRRGQVKPAKAEACAAYVMRPARVYLLKYSCNLRHVLWSDLPPYVHLQIQRHKHVFAKRKFIWRKPFSLIFFFFSWSLKKKLFQRLSKSSSSNSHCVNFFYKLKNSASWPWALE